MLSCTVLRALIERRAHERCEYCHAPQQVCGYRFHLDHIVPQARGGSDLPSNRTLSCAPCNLAKGGKTRSVDPVTRAQVPLFNPRSQTWEEHFRWARDRQTLIGRTPIGRATVEALNMNSELRKEARRLWFDVGLLF